MTDWIEIVGVERGPDFAALAVALAEREVWARHFVGYAPGQLVFQVALERDHIERVEIKQGVHVTHVAAHRFPMC